MKNDYGVIIEGDLRKMDLPSLLSIHESFYPREGGAEKRAFETLTRLAKKGFEVKAITNPFPHEVELSEIEIEYVTDLNERQYFNNGSRRILGVSKFTSAVRKAVRRDHDYDIFTFDEFPLLPAIKGASEVPPGGVKFMTWHEVLADFYLSKGPLWKRVAHWENEVAHLFNNNIAVSKTVASVLESKYGTLKTSVIENGVNVKEYRANGNKTWGKIIYVGRLEPHKRLDRLISIFSGQEKYQLEIIGRGSQSRELKRLAEGKRNIRVLGHLEHDELVSKFKDAWLFLMPSLREGFSIASLEAMAASVPVITVESQFNLAANEIIRNGKNGIVAKDFDDMNQKIQNLYDDSEAWSKLSENAREFSKGYDWEVIVDRLAEAFVSAWQN